MGMACAYHAASDATIAKLLGDPALVWRLLAPDDPEVYLDEANDAQRVGFFGRLLGRKKAPEITDIPDFELSPVESMEGDIDKAWHGLHYCLNGTKERAEPPLDFLIDGGELVGQVDVGWGPARAYRSSQAHELHQVLATIDRDRLREGFHPAEMDRLDIYPTIWVRDGDEGFDYIAEWFDRLKEFIAHCATHGIGFVIYLC
ncbi:MAG: YfbM family protein [Pseudomonadota bacterium]